MPSMTKKTPVKKTKAKAKIDAKRILGKVAAPKSPPKPSADDALARVAKAAAAPTPTPPPDAQARFDACTRDIDAVLRKHRCRIEAALAPPEAVGGQPISKMMISAVWGIMPEA